MAEGMSHRQTKKYLVAHVFSGVFFRDKKKPMYSGYFAPSFNGNFSKCFVFFLF